MQEKRRRKILELILSGLFVYLAFVAVLYLAQRNFIYFPDRNRPDPSAYEASDMTVMQATTEDGLTLTGWYKAPEGDKPVIVVFHGNASHMGMSAWKMRRFMDHGYGALLPAYRGYAGNPGKPTEKGLYRDGRAFIEWLKKKQRLAEDKIILYGESLGTGVAVEMASTQYREVKAVILESPYTSFGDLAQRQYFFVPFVRYLVRDCYRNIDKISEIDVPLLIVSGKLDMIVPAKMGRKLYEAAHEPKEIIEVSPAGHNNLYMNGAGQKILHFLSGL